MKFRLHCFLAVALTGLLVPTLLMAHAVVYPKQSGTRSYEKYVLRVPNERDVATQKVSMVFPNEIRVLLFMDVPGWSLTIQKDSTDRIISAEWSGNLPAERFVEFPFIAVNPAEGVTLNWPATQVYVGGEVVNWTGPNGSKTPASQTVIIPSDQTSKH